MSNASDCFSTRAVVVVPSDRRTVTIRDVVTTWTFVRMMSGATKNPLPRPAGV
jgi:hypothetical protein